MVSALVIEGILGQFADLIWLKRKGVNMVLQMVLQQTTEIIFVFIVLVAVIYLGRTLWRSFTKEEENSRPQHSVLQQQDGTASSASAAPELRIAPSPGSQSTESEDVILSMAVGAATNSIAIGYVAGGSLLGAVVGAALADDSPFSSADADDHSAEQSDTYNLDFSDTDSGSSLGD